jgi:drug/metabolite transporter (DMT)-like permease
VADLMLTLATAAGEVGIVSLLSSLSPPITAVLALVISRERLTWLQAAGVVIAGIGVLLVAASG